MCLQRTEWHKTVIQFSLTRTKWCTYFALVRKDCGLFHFLCLTFMVTTTNTVIKCLQLSSQLSKVKNNNLNSEAVTVVDCEEE